MQRFHVCSDAAAMEISADRWPSVMIRNDWHQIQDRLGVISPIGFVLRRSAVGRSAVVGACRSPVTISKRWQVA